MEELHHSFLRVPYEQSYESFRQIHKVVTRDINTILKDCITIQCQDTNKRDRDQELENEFLHEEQGKKRKTQSIANSLKQLNTVVERLQNLQATVQKYTNAQRINLERCHERTQYLRQCQDTNAYPTTIDRFVLDYIISQGHFQTANKLMQNATPNNTCKLSNLVDLELHKQWSVIAQDLDQKNLNSALQWCHTHATKLRKINAALEFRLRLQEFTELVRASEKLRAIHFAQQYLTPLAQQQTEAEIEYKKQSLSLNRAQALLEIQEAMTTLAFETPVDCGVSMYADLFAESRWQTLKALFRQTFFAVYQLSDPSALGIALHAGFSALNTRTCAQIRERKRKFRAKSNSEINEKNGMKSLKLGKNLPNDDAMGGDVQQANTIIEDMVRIRNANNVDLSLVRAQSRNKIFSHTLSPTCPACSDIGTKFCLLMKLPYAVHAQSRLVCRITNRVMNDRNPPLVLPNGHVYSQEGVSTLYVNDIRVSSSGITNIADEEEMKEEEDDTNGNDKTEQLIRCPLTDEVFPLSDLKPVFIL